MQPGSKNDKQPSLCDKNTPNEAKKFKIQNSKFKIGGESWWGGVGGLGIMGVVAKFAKFP